MNVKVTQHAIERYVERVGKAIQANHLIHAFKKTPHRVLEYLLDNKLAIVLKETVWVVSKSQKNLQVITCYGPYSEYQRKNPEATMEDIKKHKELLHWKTRQQFKIDRRIYG